MRAAPAVRTAATFAWRNVLLAILIVLTAMIGLALLTEAMSDGDGSPVYLANFSSNSQVGPNGPSIVVTGTGRATAPAERAIVQMVVMSSDQYYPGMRTDPEPEATPGAADRMRVEPILRALDDHGVEENTVEVIVSPVIGCSYFGPGSSCFAARIDFSVEQPTLDGLNAIINAVGDGAPEVGLMIDRVGASYEIGDCAPLQHTAREQATEDARRRAEQQAEVLGVALGGLLLSSEVPPAAAEGGCGVPQAEQPSFDVYGRAITGMAPPFDPTAPTEAVAVVQVNLAFAIPTDDPDA
ncbi:MAG: SIMPL domain-containing protein [Thermomicrobiales bacterium]